MSEKKDKGVSRRTFLNYTLTGVGGFLAAGMLTPMVRFAIDPALKKDEGGSKVAVGSVDDFTTEPKNVTFKVKTKDGWYVSDSTLSAYIYKDNAGNIVALSPICTHLGCTVQWNTQPDHPEHFFCPCHFGLYTKDGVNVPNTPPPAPLWVYETEIRDGKVYLGKPKPRA